MKDLYFSACRALYVAVGADHTLWHAPVCSGIDLGCAARVHHGGCISHVKVWTAALVPQLIASTVSWDAASPQKKERKTTSKSCGLKTHAGSYFFGISGSFARTGSRFCRTWLRADCFHTVGVFSLRSNLDDVKQMRQSATRRKNRRLNLDFGVKNW